jgi:hypothetical protein
MKRPVVPPSIKRKIVSTRHQTRLPVHHHQRTADAAGHHCSLQATDPFNAAKTCVVDCFEMGSEEMSPRSGRSSPGWLQFLLSNGQLIPFEGASALKWLTCSLTELGTNRMGAASSVKSRETVKVGRLETELDQDVCYCSRVVNGIAQGAETVA